MSFEALEEILNNEAHLNKLKTDLVNKAIEKAGSTSALSREVKIPRQSLSHWKKGAVVPGYDSLRNLVNYIKNKE
jgi:hypothetical protein